MAKNKPAKQTTVPHCRRLVEEREPDGFAMRCPDCGKSHDRPIGPGVSYTEACWIAMRILLIMGEGYANASQEEKDAIALVGDMLWGHMLYGSDREGGN
jgi:hypothetical protein